MGIFNWFQKDVNRAPADLNEAQTLHLLVRLVTRIDDRQQALVQQVDTIIRQNVAIIDQSNRILDSVRSRQEP